MSKWRWGSFPPVVCILVSIGFTGFIQAETGFEQGNQYEAITLDGSVRVQCGGGRDSENTIEHCSSAYISPSTHSHFVTDHFVDAHYVRLTVTQPSGKVKEKTEKFVSEKQKTKKQFNLWGGGLFRGSLLRLGRNLVSYELLDQQYRVVENGNLEVTGEITERRQCPYGFVRLPFASDCRDYARICDQYFRKYNYCR